MLAVFAVIACRSVRPFICPSLRSQSYIKTAKCRITQTSGTIAHDSSIMLQISRRNCNGIPQTGAPNAGGVRLVVSKE